jgi:hypothetical protein
MQVIARRDMLKGIIFGAVASLGLAAMPKAAKSLPLAAVKDGAVKPDLVEEARVTVHMHPRRHRRRRNRRWRCWWHRGRRVCGWRQ